MTSTDVEKLAQVLGERFDAEVETEQVVPGRYRFGVVSPRFRDMPQLDRQDAIWAVVNDVMSREATLGITLILAFAPDELERAA